MAVMDIKESQLAIHESHENGTQQIDYAITLSKSLGITVYPHLINEEDVRDAGCEIPVQLEDLVDEYGGIDIMEGNEGHFCIVWVETSRKSPFMSSIFHLVLLITFSAIAKTTLIISYFHSCGQSTFKHFLIR